MAEDDDLVARVFSAILERYGCYVVRVAGGKAAIEAARQGHFDIALLDLGLPDLSGIDVAREIHDMPAAPPMIALTGSDTQKDRDDCAEAGMVGYLVKPMRPDALASEIARHLQPVVPS